MRNIIFSLFVILSFTLLGQQTQEFRQDFTIPSEAFGDDRKISVYLPSDYYNYPDQKYTLTYVLDGQSDLFMDLVVKTIDYNSHMYNFIPTIVVGVHAKERGWEFSQPEEGDEKHDYKGGRAPELQEHFKKEIFPFMDSAFERSLDFRTIIGHSSGGQFVLNTLFGENSDLFDAYIGISPALRPGENKILEMANVRFQNNSRLNKFLYCSTGTVGGGEEIFDVAIDQLDSLLKTHPNNGLLWQRTRFTDFDHFMVVGPSVNEAMVFLTRAFRPDEMTILKMANKKVDLGVQLDRFYKNRQEEYGFSEIPLAGQIHFWSLALMRKENYQAATELYSWGIKKHPNNYTLRKSKGKLYLKIDQEENAEKLFREALEVLNSIKDKVPEDFYTEQLDYINKKLESLK